jgi:serine/threonine protein kinase
MASRHKWVHDEGSCLADYEFDIDDPKTRLGEGASGVVVVGRNRRDSKLVAIKIMLKDKLSDEDIAAVAVEVDAMNKVKGHPHCVELYDMYDEPKGFYLAIELVRGGELFTQLASGEPYFEAQAREAMHQMASAIEWCHRSGVVHRDLKVSRLLFRVARRSDASAWGTISTSLYLSMSLSLPVSCAAWSRSRRTSS